MRTRLPSALAVVIGLALGATLGTSFSADASRNSAGTYSLPAGNPVVSGTTISSSWANNTLSDIGSELTNSLDRGGRGAMLAPLQLASGTAAAPGLTFSGDPDTGLYRAGANDIRMQVDASNAQRWTSSGTTIPSTATLTCQGTAAFSGSSTFSGAITTQVGLTSTNSTSNGSAITATGNGTGAGVTSTGGSSNGDGVRAVGGAPNGDGVDAAGTGTGPGVRAVGGHGVLATGTSFQGVFATGAASYEGVYGANGTAATATLRQNAIVAGNGDFSMAGVTDPASNTAVSDGLTPKNIVKAWAKLTTTGGGSSAVTVNDGFNVTSATTNANGVVVTVASAFTSTNYIVLANGFGNLGCYGHSLTTTTVQISCFTSDPTTGALYGFTAGAAKVLQFIAIGAQ